MASQRPKLSLLEKVDFAFRIVFRFLLPATYHMPRAFILAKKRGMDPKVVIGGVIFRLMIGNMPLRYLQSLSEGGTVENYRKWLTKKKSTLVKENSQLAGRLYEDIEAIPGTDAQIAWIGDRMKATRIVVFFHGGGYVAPATPGHFEWVWNAYIAGGPGEKESVAVAFIHYTLAPAAVYPQQLTEVCAGLRMVLKGGILPSKVIFGGDSAGGNLTAQVLRHLVEPHPHIEPILLKEPVAGAFLVSPLVDCRTNTRSFIDNDGVDMISAKLANDTAEVMFVDRKGSMTIAEQRALALPMEGSPEWLKRLSFAAKKVYITGGKHEVFRDQIVQFAELARRQCPSLDIRLELGEFELHDAIVVEGLGNSGDATKRMQDWARETL